MSVSIQVCQNVIQTRYVLGVQRVQRYGNSLEFKLLGNPWSCGIDGQDGLHGRSLICHLFHALASHNWKPVTSADVSAKYVRQDNGVHYPIDVDSIFFTYDLTPVQPSAPPPPYSQPYSQPYTQPPSYGLWLQPSAPPPTYSQPYSQPYTQPPSYGFLQQDNPPPYDPPAYGSLYEQ